MCGIVGYIGPRDAVPILIGGLEKLEYRGYDSAGISEISDRKFDITRSEGKLSNLRSALQKKGKLNLNWEYEWIEKVYNKYFCFIKINIEKNNIINIDTEEDLLKIKTNFNLPTLGKIGCSMKKIRAQKNKYNKIQNILREKKNDRNTEIKKS